MYILGYCNAAESEGSERSSSSRVSLALDRPRFSYASGLASGHFFAVYPGHLSGNGLAACRIGSGSSIVDV
jgi:hypothetical protein